MDMHTGDIHTGDTRAKMLALIRNRRQGFSLEQPFSTDPDFFRLDMELIWYRDWLFVGHDCEIAKPGSYFTLQVGDHPVVVVRGYAWRPSEAGASVMVMKPERNLFP